VIAGLHIGDVGADLFDDPGRFVTEHRGSGCGIEPSMKCSRNGRARRPRCGSAPRADLASAADVLDHQRLLTSYRTAAFIGVSSFLCLRHSGATQRVEPGIPDGLIAFPDSRFARSGMTTYLKPPKQFANLGHADGALAEQMAGDRALHRIFREPERIARRDAMIDHHARQQQSSRITLRIVRGCGHLPRPRHGRLRHDRAGWWRRRASASLSIRRPPRAQKAMARSTRPRKVSRQACGTFGLSSSRARAGRLTTRPRRQWPGRPLALKRIDSRRYLRVPSQIRAEMGVAHTARGGEFLDIADARRGISSASAQTCARARWRRNFQGRGENARSSAGGILAAGLAAIQRVGP